MVTNGVVVFYTFRVYFVYFIGLNSAYVKIAGGEETRRFKEEKKIEEIPSIGIKKGAGNSQLP